MGSIDQTPDRSRGDVSPTTTPDQRKPLTPAAERALAEAAARRAELDRKATERPKELHGRADGLDPARYGDWEVKGICSDF
ncbi:MAG TPA: DUF1674 domain-containing protein [Xanthobacteraceae bacterium]|nr:DUF1674 domain-containing protein [Xanthobacteraceae bacterium]